MVTQEDSSVFDCVIIGAGVSGLSCAQSLIHTHGIDRRKILILEASEYVGGRIAQNQDFLKGVRVELGAEIIHGPDTSLTRFSEETGQPIEQFYCWSQGDGGPGSEPVDGGYALYYIKDASEKPPRLLRFDDEDKDFVHANEVMGNICELDLDSIPETMSLKDYLRNEGLNDSMLAMAEAGFANTLCGSADKISMKQVTRFEIAWLQESAEEGEYRFVNSFKCLIDHLKENVNITLKEPVNTLTYGTKSKSGLVEVGCISGATYFAKSAVISASPRVIQRGRIRFNPTLPMHKIEAYNCTDMQPAMKVFLKFKSRCWPKNLHGMIVAGCPVPEIWFRDCKEKVDQYNKQVKSNENKEVGTCYCTGFITSRYYENLVDKSDEEIFQIFVEELEEIFSHLEPRHMSAEPNTSEERPSDLPKPQSVFVGGMVQKWDEVCYPYIGGGYHSPLAGKPINYPEVLSEPIDNQLFFCGEALNEDAGLTAHSAMDTGTNIAIAVAKSIASKTSKL